MKINNSLDVARWEKIKCHCKKDDIEKCYPLMKCEHCRCEECWKSVPKENFKVIERKEILDKETGEITITENTKTIKEITLVRGHDLQDVIGWEWA